MQSPDRKKIGLASHHESSQIRSGGAGSIGYQNSQYGFFKNNVTSESPMSVPPYSAISGSDKKATTVYSHSLNDPQESYEEESGLTGRGSN
jgi:hypothetical protein